MRLTRICIKNFRSIRDLRDMRIENLQGIVGENNAGKSNVLRAIECFLSSGAGGVIYSDFNDPGSPIEIEAEFGDLSDQEKKNLRTYLIGDRLILQKKIQASIDERSSKTKIESEYHGYRAEPVDWWLSVEKVPVETKTSRPDWEKVAREYGLIGWVRGDDGKVTKASYAKGLVRYLAETDGIQYDEPQLGDTQALGLQQNLLSNLPEFFLLPAITDYSDEISKRSNSTVFRRLMSDLADRIMRTDPRYIEIEQTLEKLRALLNPSVGEEGQQRIEALAGVEMQLHVRLKQLMPDIDGVELEIAIDEPAELFSKGVSIKIDDGTPTDVLAKGHGTQRSIVFALLQMLIDSGSASRVGRSIMLAVEEPELYIHPHSQRMIYGVLRDFATVKDDQPEAQPKGQVIYTTHSPAFIDIGNYEKVAIVRKNKADGTMAYQCPLGALESGDERKDFKLLTSFSIKHNELFFARDCLIVEGPEDEIAIVATARELGRFSELPDEIGLSIVVTYAKGDIPKFQKVLNAFGMKYGVLLELDNKGRDHKQTAPILDLLNGNRIAEIESKLETILAVGRHFDDVPHAKRFFSDPENINDEIRGIVETLLPAR
ncbi:MAG: hypothetical protein EP335_14235 [Alphaproteobacteria bacterium]|nr:MAG: hypothetical protein EP335_14235 [Alphaproteobacteria bacterium]